MKHRYKTFARGGFAHYKAVVCLWLLRYFPSTRTRRHIFVRWSGVQLLGNNYFIASDVQFDSVYPQNIVLHDDVHLTSGVRLLTHLLDTDNPDRNDIHWVEGHIEIGEHAFIGTDTIITGNVHIGRGAIIGAGSVVTKNVPDYEIWAGNPARFIKKRP